MRIIGVGTRLTDLRHALWTDSPPTRNPLFDPVLAAMTDAGVSTVDKMLPVDCLDEVPAMVATGGTLVLHDDESAVVFSADAPDGHAALGDAEADEVEHTEQGDSLTDLVTAVIRLRHRILPGPRPWVTRTADRRRVAAVGPLTLVADSAADAGGAVAWHPDRDALLVPLSADDPAGLAARAREVAELIDAGGHPRELPRSPGAGRLTAVVVGRHLRQLRAELDTAARDLPALASTWSTPAGSYCTARPLGRTGRVAFVYPGGFSAYPGACGDLFRLFPFLQAGFEAETAAPADRFRLAQLYPITPDRGRTLREDAVTLLTAGLNSAVLGTRLLRDLLGIRPDGAIAYSFGELTSLFALDVLDLADWSDRALRDSPVWTDRLSGRRSAARDAWRRPAGPVWATHVVLAGEHEVRAASRGLDKVFLTHVNTPTETVLAGDPAQCAEVLARIGRPAAPSPANHIVHCPLLADTVADLAALHDHPRRRPSPVELFSSAPAGERVGHTVATALSAPLDFPRMVEAAYRRGFRYFVEVGPAAGCTRWIREILGTRDHLAHSLDQRGASTDRTLVRLLAGLVSHGVPVDLDRLFPPAPLLVAQELVLANREVVRAATAAQRAALTRLAAANHDRNGTP
ncbi:hypothetical protein [Actinophytocola sediminis]